MIYEKKEYILFKEYIRNFQKLKQNGNYNHAMIKIKLKLYLKTISSYGNHK